MLTISYNPNSLKYESSSKGKLLAYPASVAVYPAFPPNSPEIFPRRLLFRPPLISQRAINLNFGLAGVYRRLSRSGRKKARPKIAKINAASLLALFTHLSICISRSIDSTYAYAGRTTYIAHYIASFFIGNRGRGRRLAGAAMQIARMTKDDL